jgi:lipid-binding SYLF domain-containing protein
MLAGLWILATNPWAADSLETRVQTSIEAFKRKDDALRKFFESSRGYAVFPNVGKGGIGLGGAHGRGLLFEQGKAVGEVTLTQVTLGFQLGGQSYAEVIFFETEAAVESLKSSRFALNAQASAVAAAEGAAANAKYQQGVAIFTMVNSGLMYEATVGGQKFKYKPLSGK